MSTTKIGPREQQLREQREQSVKAKKGRPRVRPIKPETTKDWHKQLSASKAQRNRKDRRK